jgi:hypothetical protein
MQVNTIEKTELDLISQIKPTEINYEFNNALLIGKWTRKKSIVQTSQQLTDQLVDLALDR